MQISWDKNSKRKKCPYCKSESRYYFNHHSRAYYKCEECGLVYKANMPHYKEVLLQYSENYYDRYSSDQMEGKRYKLYNHILNLIKENKKKKRLLDVGTGCGFFLVAARNNGWQVKGVEPSQKSIEVAVNKNELDIFNGTLREYQTKDKYDIITFINVLEHTVEPWKVIDRASKLLAEEGGLYLRFPNGFVHATLCSVAKKLNISKYVNNFLVFHQFSFTPEFIKTLLKNKGFSSIIISNSLLTDGDPNKLSPGTNLTSKIKKVVYFISSIIEYLSLNKILLGPSIEVVAFKIND